MKETNKNIDVSPTSLSSANDLAGSENSVGSAGLVAPAYSVNSNSQQNLKGQTTGDAEGQQEASTGETLTFYAHGFIPQRDFITNSNRNENGERLESEDYNGYWHGIDAKFEERFTALAPVSANTYYMDGSASSASSARDRYQFGLAAAQLVNARLKAGQLSVVLDENDCITNVINIVGHSMGGAYAAGLARGLLDINSASGKKIFNVRAVYYLAPHQPMDFMHPGEIRGVQYSHKEDRISSQGIVPNLAGSILGPINGISEYNVFDVGIDNDDTPYDSSLLGQRGGHNVDLHDYIFDEYESMERGHIAQNSDTDYDNYENDGPAPEKPRGRLIHLPKVLDSVGDAINWVGTKGKQAAGWIGEKAKQSADWVKKTGVSLWNRVKSWF